MRLSSPGGTGVDLAIVSETTDAVLEYADDGGDVLLLANREGTVADETVFDYRELPEDESWNLVASLLYTVDNDFEALLGRVPGWELEGLYPYTVATNVPAEDVDVGSIEGWLANPSATIASRQYGAGSVHLCTFRLADALADSESGTEPEVDATQNDQPMASLLLERVLETALEA